ncbi:helix-turn-helix transcriptional regulator [Nocardia sp. 2]|uniref:Helix-turn-helix transcriptional regulator n=1 Tax=Nocardia acididurans TaxID=2802282 RepID=A0ABS1MHW6_9NOCA|nr:helix-turn-helix transcriptional regulator [Nocardia acididurans]MBL1080248.1 helix-turn-helix transcriptional regulator [Nocardia acididurans]
MSTEARHCRHCAHVLPPDVLGILCADCGRHAGFQRPLTPAFYDRPDIRDALARYDFGPVFRAVRAETEASQLNLGVLLDLSQSRVSAVERGERRLCDVGLVARIAEALGIPAQHLGFTPRPPGNLAIEQEVSWVNRRDFITWLTAIALGTGLSPDLDRLTNRATGKTLRHRQIGAGDIEAVETMTKAFRQWDLAHGGELCRAAAEAQLQQVYAWDRAHCTPAIRARLGIATADLASMTGWLTYDVAESADDHGGARQHWGSAFETALGQDHPRSTDLAVSVLLDLAHQYLHLHQARHALQVVQLAAATASSRFYPVSTITAGYISVVLAWCWAMIGEIEPTRRALGQAQELYAAVDGDTPPWAWFVTEPEIAGQQGHALYLLSLHHPQFAPEAIEHLTVSVAGHGETFARTRAVVLPTLAGAYVRAGDLDAALHHGQHALTAATKLSSQRCYRRLGDLHELTAAHNHRSDIADFRRTLVDAVPGLETQP